MDSTQLVCIGLVKGTHGLKGCLRVNPTTVYPDYYLSLSSLIVNTGSTLKSFGIQHIRLHRNNWHLQLAGIQTIQQAETLKGKELLLTPEQLKPLADDEYLCHDLIGCQVLSTSGCPIGHVKSLQSSKHHQVLEISSAKIESLLVPFTKEAFPKVNIKERCLTFHSLPGMEEEQK